MSYPSERVAGAPTTAKTTYSKQWLVLVALGITAACVFLAAASLGAIPVSPLDLFMERAGRTMQRTVLLEIRLPRVLLAAFVGAALAVAGASLQALFRNPLADPGLIGVSGGAAVGAIAMIVFGTTFAVDALMPYLVPLSAVAGASGVTLFLYAFSRQFGNFSVTTMLLVGIALNALAQVGIGAFEYLSDDTQLRTLVFWMMGSFGRGTWTTVLPSVAVISIAVAILLLDARRLDILQLGESDARNLGVDVDGLKKRVILASAAAVGAGVAVAGIVVFIGLVVPHLVRLLGGARNPYVLTGSMFLGAALTVVADLVARTVVLPAELPVGLVTSALGAPFFLWLIARTRPQ
ncbi:MAG: iron ABC transporter permease [Pseudomonadota bacterium]